jgi:hypothetical protein
LRNAKFWPQQLPTVAQAEICSKKSVQWEKTLKMGAEANSQDFSLKILLTQETHTTMRLNK